MEDKTDELDTELNKAITGTTIKEKISTNIVLAGILLLIAYGLLFKLAPLFWAHSSSSAFETAIGCFIGGVGSVIWAAGLLLEIFAIVADGNDDDKESDDV